MYNNSKRNFDENKVEKYFNLGGDLVVTIKEIADKYKGVIPQRLYDAMVNYEVEIID